MGQSAGLIWPEAIEDDDDDRGEAPEFHYPYFWAHWLGLLDEHQPALSATGSEALFTCFFHDIPVEDAMFRPPAELASAAHRLKDLVSNADASAIELAELYDIIVEDFQRGDPDNDYPPTREMFLRELDVVSAMADWATRNGKNRVAFEVG